MKKAFQLCETCSLKLSCPTGVALESFECGMEIEIRTCKEYKPVKMATAAPLRKEDYAK